MKVDQDPRVDDPDDAAEADDADDPGASGASPDERRSKMRRLRATVAWMRRRLVSWRLIALTLAVVAAVGLAGGLFFFQYRPDQQTDNAVAHAAIAAASEGAVAILSYAPASVDHDLTVAQSHLTGDFARYFREFGQRYVAPAVRQQDVKASAAVLRAAVSELHPDSAVVLLFIHQTTTGKDKPQPVLTSSNVRATLTKIGRSWLISQFEPL